MISPLTSHLWGIGIVFGTIAFLCQKELWTKGFDHPCGPQPPFFKAMKEGLKGILTALGVLFMILVYQHDWEEKDLSTIAKLGIVIRGMAAIVLIVYPLLIATAG